MSHQAALHTGAACARPRRSSARCSGRRTRRAVDLFFEPLARACCPPW